MAAGAERVGGGSCAEKKGISLQILCTAQLVNTAKQMHGALQMVERNNSQLLERKLQLQVRSLARRGRARARSQTTPHLARCARSSSWPR